MVVNASRDVTRVTFSTSPPRIAKKSTCVPPRVHSTGLPPTTSLHDVIVALDRLRVGLVRIRRPPGSNAAHVPISCHDTLSRTICLVHSRTTVCFYDYIWMNFYYNICRVTRRRNQFPQRSRVFLEKMKNVG